MRRRHIARKAVKTAIIAKTAQRLAQHAEKHLGKHKQAPPTRACRPRRS